MKREHDTDAVALTHDEARAIVAVDLTAIDTTTAALRRKAAEIRKRRRPAAPPSPPPPVAALLRGFAHTLADRVRAIDATLLPDERTRLRAIAPGFTQAVAANEPDVVRMVTMLLAMAPDWAALWIRAHLDLFERRFAS